MNIKGAHLLICFIAASGLIVGSSGCKKQKLTTGCSDKAAVNYNGTNSCSYGGSAVFYVDVEIPPRSSIQVLVDSQAQGQTISSGYQNGFPIYGTTGCASFWENWTDSSTKTVQFNVTARCSKSYCKAFE
jgi:hypothetical protein